MLIPIFCACAARLFSIVCSFRGFDAASHTSSAYAPPLTWRSESSKVARSTGSKAKLNNAGLSGQPWRTPLSHNAASDCPAPVRNDVEFSVYKSLTMASNFGPTFAVVSPSITASCEIEPKAFDKSINARQRLCLPALASSRRVSTRKLFSYTPSWAGSHFWAGQ